MNIYHCSPHDRIIRATVSLQRDKPFFSYILMNFNIEETKPNSKCPTMAVNKYGNMYWGEGFVDALDDAGLRFVLCHEILHIAKGDLFRCGIRDPQIWNIAADCIINYMLIQEGIQPPKMTEKLRALLTPEGDEKAKKELKKKESVGLIPDSRGNIELNGKTYNCQDKTTEALYDELLDDATQLKVQMCDGQGHGGLDQHLEGDADAEGESTGREGDNKSAAEHAAQSNWEKVAVEGATLARQAGQESGMIDDLIGKILDPVVDWRYRLRELVTEDIPIDFETRYPGRAFYATKVWSPRMKHENVSIFISVDCSGSTSGDRQRFVSECYGILQSHPQVTARVICWDTNVDPENDVELTTETAEQLADMNIINACGGTELSSYTKYLDEKGYDSRVHIILTDGYIESKPDIPNGNLIFVLCRGGSDEIVKEYGSVLWLTDEDPDYDS